MDPAKLEAIMLKIRKGATSNVTPSQIAAVFTVLDPGWKLDKVVGLVKLYGNSGNEERAEYFYDKSNEEVERRRKPLESKAVTSLPLSPKAGELYVLDLTPIVSGPRDDFEFHFKPWMGSEGWKVTTSSGKTHEFYPWRHAFGDFYNGYKKPKMKDIQGYEIIAWLNKETDWLDQINKKLGIGSFEKAVPRTRESTGSCSVCFQNIKLRNGTLVLHGYKRPGHGSAVGNCFGVGYEPFELSSKGCKDYLDKRLEPQHERIKDLQHRLKADEIDSIFILWSHRTVTRDDPQWKVEFKRFAESTESELKALEEEINAYKKLIAKWKERPLPQEGEAHIDWFYQGQK